MNLHILRITLCVVLWLVTAARRNNSCSNRSLLPLLPVTTGCSSDKVLPSRTRHQRMLDRIDWCLVHPGMVYGVLPLYPFTSVVMPAFEPAFFCLSSGKVGRSSPPALGRKVISRNISSGQCATHASKTRQSTSYSCRQVASRNHNRPWHRKYQTTRTNEKPAAPKRSGPMADTGHRRSGMKNMSHAGGTTCSATQKTKKPPCGGFFVESWRPHGDSNPGYRRERAVS